MSPPQDGSVLMARQNAKWIEAGGGRKCEVTSRNMRWPGLSDRWSISRFLTTLSCMLFLYFNLLYLLQTVQCDLMPRMHIFFTFREAGPQKYNEFESAESSFQS